MSVFNLQASDLTDTAAKIQEAADRIEKSLKEIDATLAGVRDVWQGDNARTYLDKYEELKQEFPTFKNAIRSYGHFLDDVVAKYDSFNQDIASRVNV